MYLGFYNDEGSVDIYSDEDGHHLYIDAPPFGPSFFFSLGQILEKQDKNMDDVCFIFESHDIINDKNYLAYVDDFFKGRNNNK